MIMIIRSRKEINFTSSRFSRMPLCLPVRYIPSGMRLTGNSQNLFGIFRETCQVYLLTAPKRKNANYWNKKNGSDSWIRTSDQVVNSHLLYR